MHKRKHDVTVRVTYTTVTATGCALFWSGLREISVFGKTDSEPVRKKYSISDKRDLVKQYLNLQTNLHFVIHNELEIAVYLTIKGSTYCIVNISNFHKMLNFSGMHFCVCYY
jgi:hypothetical protein